MDVYVERCAGIDIGKASLVACVRSPSRKSGYRHSETRTFPTTTAGLGRLVDWLGEHQVSVVGMESTGTYWKPVYYALEDRFTCWLVNARHVKKVPGRKSDVSDAQWLAQLVECGLVTPSFVPPEPIRRLRDLTRDRTRLGRDRTRTVSRLEAVLEDAGVKLSCVTSKLLTKSGRVMIEAMIAGERDPIVLADLAKHRLRKKIWALRDALCGHFNDHHARQSARLLLMIDTIDHQITQLDTEIAAAVAANPDYTRTVKLLITIPGVSVQIAQTILAETGGDMTRFPTAGHLTSWAGLCPGNNESAGRHFSGRTRKGNSWLTGALGNAAAAATRTKTNLAHTYHRIARHRGKGRALVATSREILQTAWHMLTRNQPYQDPKPA